MINGRLLLSGIGEVRFLDLMLASHQQVKSVLPSLEHSKNGYQDSCSGLRFEWLRFHALCFCSADDVMFQWDVAIEWNISSVGKNSADVVHLPDISPPTKAEDSKLILRSTSFYQIYKR
jgi:hypothetical protein